MKVYVDAGIGSKHSDTDKELLAALASLKKGMHWLAIRCPGWRVSIPVERDR